MKLGTKKGWKSIMPLRLRGKSRTRFCMFSKVRSAGSSSGSVPVYLNVYDLTPTNGYVYWAGLGIFHSGVEVHGVEYAFGAHDYPTSGVFEVEPRQCPGFKFRKSIFMGTTCLDPLQIREFMERHAESYKGDTYHLIVKNCNHFSKDICYKLTGNPIPKWVNRLARIGSLCSCLLPEGLQVSAVRHEPGYQAYGGDGEKRRLRSAFSCLSSISIRQRHLSAPSLLLHSPLKGCLPPWELRRPTSFLKESPGVLSPTKVRSKRLCRSTFEAEYRAMSTIAYVSCNGLNVFQDLRNKQTSHMHLYYDNKAAIHISANPGFHESTKHIEIDRHFVWEKILDGLVYTPCRSSEDQRAAIFTKSLTRVGSMNCVEKCASR